MDTESVLQMTPAAGRFFKSLCLLAKLELKNWMTGRAALMTVLLVFLSGGYAVDYGASEIGRQRQVIESLPGIEQAQIRQLQEQFPEGTHAGMFAYSHFIHTVHEPSRWADLSIGQRDVHPYALKIRLLGLQSQLYDSGIENPFKLLSGNFDFTFVMVFLFPLWIIASTYNLLSSEREEGRWSLLFSQPISPLYVIGIKLLVRMGGILFLSTLLFLFALLWTGIGWDAEALHWWGILSVYLLFWFGAVFFVLAFHQSSIFNAMTLIGIWVLWTVMLPALLNLFVAAYFPVPQGVEMTLRQREAVNAGWDIPKEETFEKFFRKYPEWSETAPVTERFAWKWYYAMHQVGDDSVEMLSDAYLRQLKQRQAWADRLSALAPPAWVQMRLNRMAGTDLSNHLAYLESIKIFHEELKRFFYPLIFNERDFNPEDDAKLPAHRFSGSSLPQDALSGIGILFVGAIFLFGLGRYVFLERCVEK